jgi:hypothetical protein
MIIKNLKAAAKSVGINAFITNSQEKIETQLNRLTRAEDLPIMLISWDLKAAMQFNQHGYIDNPPIAVTSLLLTKAEDKSKEAAEEAAEEMFSLFVKFLQTLSATQRVLIKTNDTPITNISVQLIPLHGMAQHSGVMGTFTVKAAFNNPC